LDKNFIIAREVMVDIFTAGFSEILFTPTEIQATKNGKHAVTFCYDKDDKLITAVVAT